MHKVSRIYVANAGYKLAWYDGLLLEFTDFDSGEPTHSIYNLVNQGGKTTFLSLFFSTFDTAKDRFLQHLSNKGQRFEHYFDKDGLPGFIVVEWRLPGDLASPTRTLVTGQIVAMKKAGDTFEPERIFFWFHASPSLTLESIPAPKLPGSKGKELRSREQVMGWLHEMRVSHPGHFDYTQNQSEWRLALESEGMDVEMLHHQVDFNRKEGSMDEAFLDFKSEYDFTRRFLSLSMDNRAADDVRELVATHCRRLTRRKPLESSRLQLEKLRDTFAGFASAARDYLAADVQRQTAETDVAVACATLTTRALERLQMSDELSRFAAVQEQSEKTLREHKVAMHGEAEAFRSESFRRAETAAKTELEAAKSDVELAELEIRLFQAAELLAEQELRQSEVNQLKVAIEAAHEDIRPFREDLGQKAALLRYALEMNRQDKSRQAQAAKDSAQVASKHMELLVVEEKQLRTAMSQAERDSAQLEQRLDDAKKRRATLISDSILAEEEVPEAALERLTTSVEVLSLQVEELEARATTHEETAAAIQVAQLAQSGEKARLSARIEYLGGQISEADSWRDRLNHDAVLTRAIGAEVADPDSEVLPPSLTRFIQRTQNDLSDAELGLARLEEDERSIQETGLAGHDPDVSRVVRHLTDAGVLNASAHAEYLAEVLPQAIAARAVVMSDPGRFLGVAVPNNAQLEAARTALNTAPAINKPVVVSIASDRATAESADRIVVPPSDDSQYCFIAAQARAAKLADKVVHARRTRDEVRDLLKSAHEAETSLQQYQAKYGHGRLDQLRQELRQSHATLLALARLLAEAKDKLATEQNAAKTARDESKRCMERQSSAKGQLRQFKEYMHEYAVHLTEWQARFVAAKLAIEQRRGDLERLTGQKASLDAERQGLLDSGRQLAGEAKILADELGVLQHVDTTIDAEAELSARPRPLDILRSEHQTAANILVQIEQDKTGNLVVQRAEAQKAVEALRTKFGDAAEGLDAVEIRAHMGVDYRAALRHARERKSGADNRHIAAAGIQATARQSYAEFQRQRAHPNFALPGSENLSEGDLAFRLDDAERQARLAEGSEAAAQTQGRDARDKAKEQKQSSDTFANQAATLKGLLPAAFEFPPPDLALFGSTQGIGEICQQLARALQDARTRVGNAHKSAHSTHEKVQRIAGEESFIKVDAELSVTLKNNPLDATIQDHVRIEAAITDRIATVVSELATMDQDFDRASDQLLALVNTAIRLLQRAAEDMRLPNSVPVVGGLTVVKMPKTLFSLTHEGRRVGLKPYMEELAADGNIPESGAALATQALLRLANNRLGIRILKMVDAADEQYVPVDGLSHSGAERISMALLLYFIIAKLRYEQRAQARKAQGGVLFLDNPFAKATARPIWQAILSLADAMGVQLIITTGMKEYETLSVFRRFLRLARTERNATTGRTHVSVADFNFRPESVSEAA